MDKQRSASQIIEDIKSQIVCISKAAKTTEQMYGNLQKKDFVDMSWNKPETPEIYQGVKDMVRRQKHKIDSMRKKVKENKILSSMFKSIDRETRIKNTDPKKVIPTLNEFGAPNKFWNEKNCKIHFSTLERGSLEETRRLRMLSELENSRYEHEQSLISNSQLGISRNRSQILRNSLPNNLNASKSHLGPLDEHLDEDDDHNTTINLRDQIQQAEMKSKNPLLQHKQLGSNLNKSHSQRVLDNSKVSISRISSLPEIYQDKSQIHPHLMNLKFSRQTKRLPINTFDVNENRFEPIELFPSSLSQNKKLFWNIRIDKYKDREFAVSKKEPFPDYDPIDLEKYKFKKVYKPLIISQHQPNRNHLILGRPPQKQH
eukprot:403353302